MSSPDNVETDLVKDLEMEKFKEELKKGIVNYRKTVMYMAADAPIQVMCLSKQTENLLINNGIFRIYDLFDLDLTKIKGFGEVRIRELTTSLNEFLAML